VETAFKVNSADFWMTTVFLGCLAVYSTIMIFEILKTKKRSVPKTEHLIGLTEVEI
jgi:hypothetical protein